MFRTLLCSAVSVALLAAPVDAAKPKKQESEVQKSLKQAYPDAQTEIAATNEVNGVKVYDVKVTTKKGQSTAQITDYGDFLMYGVPHEYGAIRSAIQKDIGGIFKSTPENIEMYRVTNYFVDFKGPNNKNFTARFDAVGRLLDLETVDAAKSDAPAAPRGERVKDDATVRKIAEYVKRELPEAQLEAVYPSGENDGFMVAALTGGGEVILNQEGQVYSLRQPITKDQFPDPVAKTIQGIFTAPIEKLARGEYEYYQFNQQSQQGSPIVVKMRPNGDILEVINAEAIEQEKAQQAKSKQKD